MSDPFKSHSKGLTAPADQHFAITPNDSADLAVIPRAIRVGGSGDIVLRDKGGVDVTYPAVAGEVLIFRAVRVLATGTTATNLVGWY